MDVCLLYWWCRFTACAGIGFTIACAGGQGQIKNNTAVPAATDVWVLGANGVVGLLLSWRMCGCSEHRYAAPG